MSLDPSAFPRSISPASSDSSLTRSRLRGKEGLRPATYTPDHLKKNKNYRRYASSVERALSLFDTALQEWADYISFLSRLLKALQTHPPDLPVVPHKILVSKRLAQCLNPSLPSGVHQKAIEVYTYIFGLIKSEGLSQDLPLYLSGIAPTLTFASLTVRPLFLSLVETYICPLESWAIRPALKAIILALLPGLEEETSDDFDPTLRLINKFRDAAGQMETQRAGTEEAVDGQYFWQCLFLASITSPSRRSGVLAYLNRHLPKLGLTDRRPSVAEASDSAGMSSEMLTAANSVILPEPGLLIRCFASGLSTDQVLVQRNFLDLLVTHLPLSSPILQSRISKDDLQRLIIAAVGVVFRRDMSLNRRLWSWLLGPESSNDRASFEGRNSTSEKDSPNQATSNEISQSQYFSQFGLQHLVNGLIEMIQQDSHVSAERSKPFRMSLSLMDRWEVGGFIVPTVFLPIMRNVQAFETIASKAQFEDVFRSASAFFDGVESGIIFSELLELIDWKPNDLENDHEKVLSNLELAAFILENFNVREEDMVLVHAPLLSLALLVKMNRLSNMPQTSAITREIRKATSNKMLKVMDALVGLLTERSFSHRLAHGKTTPSVQHASGTSHEYIMAQIHKFYDQSKDSLDLPPLPFHPKQLGELIIRESHELAILTLESLDDFFPIQEKVNLLTALLKKVPKSRILRDRRLYSATRKRLDMDGVGGNPVSFSVISSITSAMTSLYFIHAPGFYISYEDISDMAPILIKQLWRFLSPSSPKYHVEAVRSLWCLHSVSWPDHLVEASITTLMVNWSLTGYHVSTVEQAEHFFVLWNHSHHGTYELPPKQVSEAGHSPLSYHSSLLERPLFIVLDLLSRGANEASQAVQIWLQDLPSIHKVFRMIVSRLDTLFLRAAQNAVEGQNLAVCADDYKECTYLFQTISEVISALSHNGWIAFLNNTVGDRGYDASSTSEDQSEVKTVHWIIFSATLKVVGGQKASSSSGASMEEVRLQQATLSTMRQLLLGPGAEELADSGVDTFLVDQLHLELEEGGSVLVQGAIIDALLAALKVRFAQAYLPPPPPRPTKHQRTGSRDRLTSPSLLSFSSEKADKGPASSLPQPPQLLLECLIKGISSPNSREILEKWMLLFCDVLVPLYSSSIFHVIMKLVECFCKEIRQSYENLQLAFKQSDSWPEDRSEHITIALLTGLETCIGTAHERLLVDETHVPAIKSPDPSQGFFGNMVSGVFTSDANQSRPSAANNRLTVLLCFQDAVRLCFSIWSWGATEQSGPPRDSECLASFQYTSLRMRNRSRRILEHLFTAEALECLETLVDMWTKADAHSSSLILDLLHTLDGSRPKITIPALFNAIYTRTNPTALDPSRKSALTSNISESELAAFLVTYARSLDDDVLDEIWTDCTTFLRDVLSNPFPHRQILPRLVEFAAILGTKLENTNFGDSRRMRKELGDVLLRILTAIFTSKPLGLSSESGHVSRTSMDYDGVSVTNVGPDDMLSILAVSMPAFTITLGDVDRVSTAVTGISTNIIGPILRSRLFPSNVNRNVLVLLQHMAKVPAAGKSWKKDIADAFNDPRFFSSQISLVKDGWMNLLRQWVLADKDRLSELMARLPPPSTAGIMFGVGASTARLEADRKAQLNLRRIALLILCATDDYFAGELPGLLQKLEDLLAATGSSSPSSATRAEIFMVLRALALKTSSTTFTPFWPLLNTELQEALSAVPLGPHQEFYNPYSMLQACKLLESLLVLAPDDFQLLEWLFVTDTIDAVYPPNRWEPTAIADEVSQSLGMQSATSPTSPLDNTESSTGVKQPWLTSDWIRETAKDEIVERVLRPFFDRLSIYAFESTYSMSSPDLDICRDDLLADLFNESTMAN